MNAFGIPFGGLSIGGTAVESMGWTLLHFLWQGSIVAALLALLDVLLSRGRPQLRYLAACAALVVMFALPIATFLVVKPASVPRSPGAIQMVPKEKPQAERVAFHTRSLGSARLTRHSVTMTPTRVRLTSVRGRDACTSTAGERAWLVSLIRM